MCEQTLKKRQRSNTIQILRIVKNIARRIPGTTPRKLPILMTKQLEQQL